MSENNNKNVTPYSERSPGRPLGQKDLYPRKVRAKMTIRKRRDFLKQLELHGSVVKAAQAVNMSRGTVYQHMRKDANFKRMVEEAKDRAMASLEEHVMDRVRDGETTVIKDGDGNIVQTVHKPVAAAIINRLLDSTENFAKKDSNTNHLHLHNNDQTAITKFAQALGLDINVNDFSGQEIEGEVVEDEGDD